MSGLGPACGEPRGSDATEEDRVARGEISSTDDNDTIIGRRPEMGYGTAEEQVRPEGEEIEQGGRSEVTPAAVRREGLRSSTVSQRTRKPVQEERPCTVSQRARRPVQEDKEGRTEARSGKVDSMPGIGRSNCAVGSNFPANSAQGVQERRKGADTGSAHKKGARRVTATEVSGGAEHQKTVVGGWKAPDRRKVQARTFLAETREEASEGEEVIDEIGEGEDIFESHFRHGFSEDEEEMMEDDEVVGKAGVDLPEEEVLPDAEGGPRRRGEAERPPHIGEERSEERVPGGYRSIGKKPPLTKFQPGPHDEIPDGRLHHKCYYGGEGGHLRDKGSSIFREGGPEVISALENEEREITAYSLNLGLTGEQ